jgi:hypothetical protein
MVPFPTEKGKAPAAMSGLKTISGWWETPPKGVWLENANQRKTPTAGSISDNKQ